MLACSARMFASHSITVYMLTNLLNQGVAITESLQLCSMYILYEPGHALKARWRSSDTCTYIHIHIQCAQYAGVLCAYWMLQVMTIVQ